MRERNALSKKHADDLYEPLHPIVQVDLLDNNVEVIVVGDKTVDRRIELEYSYELPIGGKAITGRFIFNHDGSSVDLDNGYTFLDNSITKTVTFSASIVGDDIRLIVTTSSVGENPTIKYRRYAIGVV